MRKVLSAQDLLHSQHSQVSVVSGDTGEHKQDLRLYHKHRSGVNSGMHQEVERVSIEMYHYIDSILGASFKQISVTSPDCFS